ncbi:MAG: hypothetical protein ABFD52_10590 [Acidobacteriota bacterium]
MKRSLLVPIVVLTALSFPAGAARAQVPAKPAIAGTWIGAAVVGGGGEQIEITVVLAESGAGYAGKISDASGIVPETELRQIVLKENKLSFELDLDTGSGPTLIKIELTVDGGTMKGAWSDPGGDSGAIELALKK